MKFYIKPKHFAQYRSFKIRDAQQGELFKIKGRYFLGLRNLTMRDMNAQPLYTLKRTFSMSPYRTYSVLNDEQKTIAQIRRTYGRRKPFYIIDIDDVGLHFEGTVKDSVFSLHSTKEKLVEIRKTTMPWGEAYEIEVLTEQRPLLYLFLLIAVDQMNHERRTFKHD
ncbi:MAG: hypothetical protein EA374_03960 [Acholeplasmatales bacterium]|nr:MAG: hypothetical protein EA374_03960 [Acholeplasmatales bacterium]